MEIFDTDENKPRDPSRNILAIGAGQSRTGTGSLSVALRILLDGPVCHCWATSMSREDAFVKGWCSVLGADATPDDPYVQDTLKRILAGYVAVADAPAALLVEELLIAFPDAKVICTDREKSKWWDSVRDLGMTKLPGPLEVMFRSIYLWPVRDVRPLAKMRDLQSKRCMRIYNPPSNENGEGSYEAHRDYLKRVVPADRLIFFNVKDGWTPLCKFLDRPIPSVPFPHANDRDAMKNMITTMAQNAKRKWIQYFTILGVASIAFFALSKGIRVLSS